MITKKHKKMKTLVNLTITALIAGSIISTTQAKDFEKYYEVTEEGQFQFLYRQADASPKEGAKPVTNRTFYLETKRQGILPDDLSYRKYQELTAQEIQALLDQAPLVNTTENKLNAVDQIDINKISAEQNTIISNPTEITNETQVVQPKQNRPFEKNIPWIVDVSLDPTDGYDLPDEFDAMEACTECRLLDVPQVVNDILEHGEKKSVTSTALQWESEDTMIYTAVK